MFSTTAFKTHCVFKIKPSIQLPETGYCVINESCIRLCYIVDGKYQYINLPSKEQAAKFLVENGIVDMAEGTGDNVQLYRKSFYYTTDHAGKLVMTYMKVHTPWDMVRLTRSDVQLLAARNEFDRVSKGLPLMGAKVVSINRNPQRSQAA